LTIKGAIGFLFRRFGVRMLSVVSMDGIFQRGARGLDFVGALVICCSDGAPSP
jgi:hypothetical protein